MKKKYLMPEVMAIEIQTASLLTSSNGEEPEEGGDIDDNKTGVGD